MTKAEAAAVAAAKAAAWDKAQAARAAAAVAEAEAAAMAKAEAAWAAAAEAQALAREMQQSSEIKVAPPPSAVASQQGSLTKGYLTRLEAGAERDPEEGEQVYRVGGSNST